MKIIGYHGSNARFKKFEQNKARILNDFYGGGVAYFTDSMNVSKNYSKSMTRRYGGERIIYKVELHLEKIFDVNEIFTGQELVRLVGDDPDSFGRGAGLIRLGVDPNLVKSQLLKGSLRLTGDQVFRGLSGGMVTTASARERLIELGYDALRYNGGLNMGMVEQHNVYIVYDASKIKIISRFRVEDKKPVMAEDIVRPRNSLNIARDRMPQILAADTEDFIRWLRSEGVRLRQERISVSKLLPTQGEMDQDKIAAFVRKGIKPGKRIFISKDNFILDGHHTWAALKEIDPNTLIDVYRIDLKILDLLAKVSYYPKVFHKKINEIFTFSEYLKTLNNK